MDYSSLGFFTLNVLFKDENLMIQSYCIQYHIYNYGNYKL